MTGAVRPLFVCGRGFALRTFATSGTMSEAAMLEASRLVSTPDASRSGENDYAHILPQMHSPVRSQENGARTMVRRKSTGKRLRFEVFKRDHFTCQYCGAQPPDVVLVCDHIDPVAAGGATTLDNLITACESCNQGKADIPLGHVVVRPDDDLLFLEAMQEAAELRRYQAALVARAEAFDGLIETLQDVWYSITNSNFIPRPPLIRQMLELYSPEIVHAAIVDVAGKVRTGYVNTYKSGWQNYLLAVARNMAAESEEGE